MWVTVSKQCQRCFDISIDSFDKKLLCLFSVLQSGWERKYKLHYLGKDYSDIKETNVPDIRLTYRRETLEEERKKLEKRD